jgi:hypothetical protein
LAAIREATLPDNTASSPVRPWVAMTTRSARSRSASSSHGACHGHRDGESIIDHAADLGAVLVILSMHGRGGARRVLFGRVAQLVLHGGTRPVLLIRPLGYVTLFIGVDVVVDVHLHGAPGRDPGEVGPASEAPVRCRSPDRHWGGALADVEQREPGVEVLGERERGRERGFGEPGSVEGHEDSWQGDPRSCDATGTRFGGRTRSPPPPQGLRGTN